MSNNETKWMEQCPRFNCCNVPKCPLDPLINIRIRLSGEPICTINPKIRYRIAKNSDLKYKGLIKKEWREANLGGKRWKWFKSS